MLTPDTPTPATAGAVNRRLIADQLGGKISLLNSQSNGAVQVGALHAEIIGANICQAEGFTARSASPILALCRKLIEAGYDPARPLGAYRGGTLCLAVRTLGEGAVLTVDEHNGTRFAKWKPFHRSAVSPLVAQTESPATLHHGRAT